MDRIFKEQIGCKMEVYINDVVVKSPDENRHCEVLTNVSVVLRQHKLKLYLEKCSFDVHVGKFLGFMLTQRGIEANPKKCEVVINMQSPMNIKEVQQLAEYEVLLASMKLAGELGAQVLTAKSDS
ncbi:Retrovirus-related Pol polyprotein from transposon opus, partial [Mucuna pruriens]